MAITKLACRYLKEFFGGAITGTGAESATALFGIGGGSIRCNPTTTGTGSVQFNPYTNASWGYYQVAFQIDTAPAASSEILFGDNASQWEVRVNSDLTLALYSNNTTLIQTGTTVLSAGTSYMARIYLSSGGSPNTTIQLWNGTTFVTELTGSTARAGRSPATCLTIGKYTNRNGQSVDYKFAHIAYDSAAYPPYAYNVYAEATALSGSTLWTDAAGTKPTNVQNPDDDATTAIRSTLTIGNACLFTVTSSTTLGIGSGTINAVRPVSRTKVTAIMGSTATQLSSNAVTNDSTTFANSGSWATDLANSHVMATDPNTSAAWTTGGFDACLIGMVEKATGGTSDCTTVYAIVNYTPAIPVSSVNYVSTIPMTMLAL